MIWYARGNLRKIHKIYLHGRYPAVSIFDTKIHVHRLIGLFLYAAQITRQIVVHHKDGNRLNNSIDNLELMSCSIHAHHHNKGKKLSLEHRQKISAANLLRKGQKRKKKVAVTMDDIAPLLESGLSINKIAQKYNCDWSTIQSRIKESNNPELLKDENGN